MQVTPVLYLIVPCYNEEAVLPETAPLFRDELRYLIREGKIAENSRILFVDDGSRDKTWEIVSDFAQSDRIFTGIRQSRNRGHQNAVLAGLMEARPLCDVAVSIDCDGQDDITAIRKMVDAYRDGADIVYGVRADRSSDSFWKRTTAEGYYKFLRKMGVDTVYNHADYRLTSKRVLDAFADFGEVNLFLRGMFPLVGFNSTVVTYDRVPRIAGESHYSLRKMLTLAIDGITSLSVKPIRFVTTCGCVLSALAVVAGIVSAIIAGTGHALSDAAIFLPALAFATGLILTGLGVVGEYVGKIYMEVKHRPRYIIMERTENEDEKNGN